METDAGIRAAFVAGVGPSAWNLTPTLEPLPAELGEVASEEMPETSEGDSCPRGNGEPHSDTSGRTANPYLRSLPLRQSKGLSGGGTRHWQINYNEPETVAMHSGAPRVLRDRKDKAKLASGRA